MSISSSSSESLSFRKSSGLQLRFTNMIMITKLWRAPILFELYFNQNDIGHLKRLYIYIACVFNTFCYRYLRKIISHKSSNSPCDGSLIKQLLKVLTTRGISIHLCQAKFTFDLFAIKSQSLKKNKITSEMLMPKPKLQMMSFFSLSINLKFSSFNFNLIKSR